MTDENTPLESIFGGETRRSFVKKGALASGTAVLGLSGTAAADDDQEDDDDDVFVNEEQAKCILFQNDFRPGSEFIITSPVIEWTPNVPQNLGSPFEGYNTRIIRYRGSGDNVVFFQSQDAQVPNFSQEAGFVVDDDEDFGENEFVQPEVFSLWNQASFFEGTTRLVTARFSPVEEDFENQIFDEEDFNPDDDFIF